jgi:hypothetical protein
MTMGVDLSPYVPTTAVALIAMQDRLTIPAVAQSLDYLAAHGGDETSSLSLGLAALALRICGRRTATLENRLRTLVEAADVSSLLGHAIAVLALAPEGSRSALAF